MNGRLSVEKIAMEAKNLFESKTAKKKEEKDQSLDVSLEPENNFQELDSQIEKNIQALHEQQPNCKVVELKDAGVLRRFRVFKNNHDKRKRGVQHYYDVEKNVELLKKLRGALLYINNADEIIDKEEKKQLMVMEYNKALDALKNSKSSEKVFHEFLKNITKGLGISHKELARLGDYASLLSPEVAVVHLKMDEKKTSDETFEMKVSRPVRRTKEAMRQKIFQPLQGSTGSEQKNEDKKSDKVEALPMWLSPPVMSRKVGSAIKSFLLNNEPTIITNGNSLPTSLRSNGSIANYKEDQYVEGSFKADSDFKSPPQIVLTWDDKSITQKLTETFYGVKFEEETKEKEIKEKETKEEKHDVTVTKKLTLYRYGTPSAFQNNLITDGVKEARVLSAEDIIKEDILNRLEKAIQEYVEKYHTLLKNDESVAFNVSLQRLLSPLTYLKLLRNGAIDDDNLKFLEEEEAAVKKVQEIIDGLGSISCEVNGKNIRFKPNLLHTNNAINGISWMSVRRDIDMDNSKKFIEGTVGLLEKLHSSKEFNSTSEAEKQLRTVIAFLKEKDWAFFDNTKKIPEVEALLNELQKNNPESELSQATRYELAVKIKSALTLKELNCESLLQVFRRKNANFSLSLGLLRIAFKTFNFPVLIIDKCLGFIAAFCQLHPGKYLKKLWNDAGNDTIEKAKAELHCSDSGSAGCKSARDRTSLFGGSLITSFKNLTLTAENFFDTLKAEFNDRFYNHSSADHNAQVIKASEVTKTYLEVPKTERVFIPIPTGGRKYKEIYNPLEISAFRVVGQSSKGKKIKVKKDKTEKAPEKTKKKEDNVSNGWRDKLYSYLIVKARPFWIALAVGIFITGCIFSGGLLAAGTAGGLAALGAITAATGGAAFGLGGTIAWATFMCTAATYTLKKIGQKIISLLDLDKNPKLKYAAIGLGITVLVVASVFTGGILPAVAAGVGIIPAVSAFAMTAVGVIAATVTGVVSALVGTMGGSLFKRIYQSDTISSTKKFLACSAIAIGTAALIVASVFTGGILPAVIAGVGFAPALSAFAISGAGAIVATVTGVVSALTFAFGGYFLKRTYQSDKKNMKKAVASFRPPLTLSSTAVIAQQGPKLSLSPSLAPYDVQQQVDKIVSSHSSEEVTGPKEVSVIEAPEQQNIVTEAASASVTTIGLGTSSAQNP